MDDHPDDADLDEDTGPCYREGYRLTRALDVGASMRHGHRDPAAELARLRQRLARDLGDAARPRLEALDAGIRDAEAGRGPAW